MSAVFISYRREDAEDSARALYESLVREFGKDRLFIDVEAIALGTDFREAVERSLDACGVFLVVIGPAWLDAKVRDDPSGRRRLDDAGDYVRQEVATALKRGADPSDPRKKIPVIPVLVRGAGMPSPDNLPDDLKNLAYRNALTLSHLDWDGNMQKLVTAIRPHLRDDDKQAQDSQSGPAIQAKAEALGRAAPVSVPSSPALAGGLKKAAGLGALIIVIGVIAWYINSRTGPSRPNDTHAPAKAAAASAGEAAGMPVLIVRNSKLTNVAGPVDVLIDKVQQGQIRFDEHGSTPIQIHATEGQHQFMFSNPQTKASCSGSFDVSASNPKLVLRMRDNGTVCSLQPMNAAGDQ